MRDDEPRQAEGIPSDLPGEMPDGALFRAAADGELDSACRERLDRMLEQSPGCCKRIEFERELRSACGRVLGADGQGADDLGTECCPEALRQRVLAIAAESRADEARLGEGLSERAAETREPGFWSSPRFAALALGTAAVAALAVTAALVFTAPNPGAVSPQQLAGGANNGSVEYVSFRDDVTQFVAKEHNRCWKSRDAADAKFVMTEPEAIKADMKAMLGKTVDLPAWHQPVEALVFRGSGHCHVPGSKGKSHHMRFDIPETDERPQSSVSLFIANDYGNLPLRDGTTYAIDTAACGTPGAQVLVWSLDGLVYYLVADESGGACDKVRKALSIPEPSGKL